MNSKLAKTKIICTIGPVTCNAASIQKLYESGMSIARLNGSHGTLEWHREAIRLLRQHAPLVPILLDLPGRKVRTTREMSEIVLNVGDLIVFGSSSDPGKVAITDPTLFQSLSVGQSILADDGTLHFEVVTIAKNEIVCKSKSCGVLKPSKGLNCPGHRLSSGIVTDRDLPVIEFAIDEKIDFVGLSFVDHADQVHTFRTHLKNSSIGVVAKVETQSGLENYEAIIEAADAIMIDRGDLSAETRPERVALYQKRILAGARKRGKPAIVATELLHTMIHQPIPTKAEVSDLTNAILDGASALMLSAETAVGQYFTQAVRVMQDVALAVESEMNLVPLPAEEAPSISEGLGSALSHLVESLKVDKVICLSRKGRTPASLARYRMAPPLIAITPSIETARKLMLNWGVQPLVIETIDFNDEKTDNILSALKELHRTKRIQEQDSIAVMAIRYGVKGNRINSLEVHQVRNLIEFGRWH